MSNIEKTKKKIYYIYFYLFEIFYMQLLLLREENPS